MTKYKDILDLQNNECSCGNKITGQPIFVYENGILSRAICHVCWLGILKKEEELADKKEEAKRKEEKEKEKLDWLNPHHPYYETRLKCHNGGHKVVQGGQGYVGGGCWCGYYSPEDKPLVYLDY